MFKVTNLKRGGGGEIRFPGHWLTKDGLEKELGNKVRAEGRKKKDLFKWQRLVCLSGI